MTREGVIVPPGEAGNRAAPARGAATGPVPALPLVSVVVVNYNYGRFLGEAVSCVYGQSYRDIECIVVDNASTDETPAVLADLQGRHPDLVVIRRARNDGQTPASLDGLAAAGGNYVIFLDADDYLLPHCVETHVFVHLSMRLHVAFTSGDMLQVAGRRVVVATGEESSRYIRGWRRRRRPKLVRPYRATPEWPTPAVPGDIVERIHYVAPRTVSWVWSPTSGLCYRRDALALFADNAGLATLRTGTDLYFAFGCGGLSGSVLIDEPLFAYRIHGGNIFTARAQLDFTLNFTPGGHGDSNIKAQLTLVDHLVARAARFTPNLLLKLHLLLLIFRVDRGDLDKTLPRWARGSRAARAIVLNYDGFAHAVGPMLARLALLVLAKSPRSAARLIRTLPSSDI